MKKHNWAICLGEVPYILIDVVFTTKHLMKVPNYRKPRRAWWKFYGGAPPSKNIHEDGSKEEK